MCITDSGDIVLISEDGLVWDMPGGRPEGDETSEQTMHREMAEEACASVTDARILGFCRSHCIAGHEAGLVLIRAFWLAHVRLEAWRPQFETTHRMVVPISAMWPYIPDSFAPIFRRALHAVGLLEGLIP